MKQKLKKITSFTLSLICLSLLFYNCSDDYEIHNHSDNHENLKIKFKKITLDDIQNEKVVFDKINNASKIRNLNKSNTNRIINDTINNFYIDTEAGLLIETSNTISYTFKIFRENGSNFLLENLVINKEENKDYETYLYQYNITQQELELINQNVSIDLSNKISRITLENSNLHSDIFNKEDYNGMCFVETTTYTPGQTCTEGGNHTWNDILAGGTCSGFGTLSGPWPGSYTTTATLQPCPIGGGGGGGDNGGTGGGTGSGQYGGGGSGGGSTTTSPTTTNYQKLREKCFLQNLSQNNPTESAWLNLPENTDVKKAILQYLEDSVNFDGLESQATCYPNTSENSEFIDDLILTLINEGNLKQQLRDAIANGITTTAEFTHKIFKKLSDLAAEHPNSIKYINIIIEGLNNTAKPFVNTDPQTCTYNDLFNMWLFELGENPFIINGLTTSTNQLKNQVGVNQARAIALNKIQNNDYSNSSHQWIYGQQAFYDGMSNGNLVTAFLGTYTTYVTISSTAFGYQLNFHVTNTSGWISATRFRIDNNGDGAHDGIFPDTYRNNNNDISLGGNFTQYWYWSEPLN